MMNDHTTELLETGNGVSWMTLSQAAKTLPKVSGKRIHPSTLWRWCRKGYRGVCLEYARMGRKVVVTPAALARFFVALAQAEQELSLPSTVTPGRRRQRSRSESARQRAVQEADAVLRRARILIPFRVENSREKVRN